MTYGRLFTGALLALLLAGSAVAAEAQWQHSVVVYGIGASIDGKAGIGDVTANVDVGFDDILDNLEFGAMAGYRGERGRWAIMADVIFMALEQKKNGIGPAGATRAKVEADQLILELDGSYAVTERLDAYGGLRYWELDNELEVVGGGPLGQTLSASKTEDWVDPVVGLRYLQPINERWQLIGRGDIGGFGVGSDFTWHVTAFAMRQVSEHGSLMLGFRYLDVDYDDGSGADRFRWDVTEGGPAAGFAWQF
ncbi:MAG: hypothetical protein L6Q83_01940 [Gammaproteobacteria bacterium]|nr:hypothetical protein [Gammaproteobacteria bacterium]